jgi:hypothetical protein
MEHIDTNHRLDMTATALWSFSTMGSSRSIASISVSLAYEGSAICLIKVRCKGQFLDVNRFIVGEDEEKRRSEQRGCKDEPCYS